MKKIINRKVYNTKTATPIASLSRGWRGDARAFSETLYRTPKGAFFLAGSGGPMSKYSVSCGQSTWCGGSDIIPVSERETIEWLEDNDEIDALEEYFADKIEDA